MPKHRGLQPMTENMLTDVEEGSVIMLSMATSIEVTQIFAMGIDCEFQSISAGVWTGWRNATVITGANQKTLAAIREIMLINRKRPLFYKLDKLNIELPPMKRTGESLEDHMEKVIAREE